MPSWPAELPDFALPEGYGEGFKDTVVRSKMESGATKRRSRFTDAPKELDVPIPLTGAELDVFTAFFEDDLSNGALSFTRTHPRTGATVTVAFRKTPDKPTAQGPNTFVLVLPLEVLP